MYTVFNRKLKGFTLIELLVVIAIIGILAAIVLVSLGNVRQRGANVGVGANLASIRTQAEVYAQGNGSNQYSGLCGVAPISNAIAAAKADAGINTLTNTTIGVAGSNGVATCHVSAANDAWAVEVPLLAPNTQFWCVDSGGTSGTTTISSLGIGDTTCGP